MGSVNCGISMEPYLFVINGNKEVVVFPNDRPKNKIFRINSKFVVTLKANAWDSLIIKTFHAELMLDTYEQ